MSEPQLDAHDLLLILTLCELLDHPVRAQDVAKAQKKVLRELERDALKQYEQNPERS